MRELLSFGPDLPPIQGSGIMSQPGGNPILKHGVMAPPSSETASGKTDKQTPSLGRRLGAAAQTIVMNPNWYGRITATLAAPVPTALALYEHASSVTPSDVIGNIYVSAIAGMGATLMTGVLLIPPKANASIDNRIENDLVKK